MTKEETAADIVEFFNSAHKDLMPKDPKERQRVESMIKSRVFTEFVTKEDFFDEQSFINKIVDELKALKQ